MEIEDILSQAKNVISNFTSNYPDWIVIIRWATATGKSKLSILLSDFFSIEIISADSRQIFKYMDIWTDKVSKIIRKKIPHHQIDIVNPKERYTAWEWQFDTKKIIKKIQEKSKLPIIVWWTWLYIDTIYKNFSMPTANPDHNLRAKLYQQEKELPWFLHSELSKIDPKEADKIHPKCARYLVRALEIFYQTWIKKSESFFEQRVDQPILMLWLQREKEDTNKRINIRIKQMFQDWLIQEVEKLLKKWYNSDLQSMQWIGYKQTIEYLQWKYDLHKLQENIKKVTHHLAKKQRTWFRRYILDQKTNPRENVFYEVINLS
jgi:tRNA dimethylallyltransferase